MTGPFNKKSQGSLRRLSFFKILLVMYIVYIMIIYHVPIKVFSFNSGVMLSSSFSDALLLENVFVIRLNIRARLVSLLGPTSQKQRLLGWLF